jgi:hypothetical protein
LPHDHPAQAYRQFRGHPERHEPRRLSAEAVGVLVYLLSKPSDWVVSIAELRKRFYMGRDRLYHIMAMLEHAGYVVRSQVRNDTSKRFCPVEYIVHDCPVGTPAREDVETSTVPSDKPLPEKPYPENPEAEKPQQKAASVFTASGSTVSGKSGHILKTDLTKLPYGGPPPSPEPFSLSKQCWDEARSFLDKKQLRCMSDWMKRASSDQAKHKLFAILRSAKRSGTGDPVPYIKVAVDKEFPPLRGPKSFTTQDWERFRQAAIKFGKWDRDRWGPRPGHKGCLMPAELITPELLKALTVRRVA